MKKPVSRRDFLKLAGMLPLSMALPPAYKRINIPRQLQSKQQNVLVVVYDAFSAYHLPWFGYGRDTMPRLAKLAERATVYYQHYAGGNFTTPGTASLLTGTLPWTHRALQPNGTVIEPFVTKNIFSTFPDYYRIAYTHNVWANKLLEQFKGEMDELIPWNRLFLQSYDGFIQTLFGKDLDIASVSWVRNIQLDEGYAYSLFLAHLYKKLREIKIAEIKQDFPRGIPATGSAEFNFVLENATDWIGNRLAQVPQPFTGYFHFLPPHGPYRTSLEFYNRFKDDGFKTIEKPEDIFTQHISQRDLARKRTEYDEFLLYVDKEFGRFFDYLESSGLLENTWVVFTSDHGEMFERGIDGHSVDALYEPLLRVPMLIFEPGRMEGREIHTPTSAIDIFPTMLHVTGHEIPDWLEGDILPPYATTEKKSDRSIYVVRSNKTTHNEPITRTSITLVKGRYKLTYYVGYEERGIDELVTLFDVITDPEELVDLVSTHKEISEPMLAELKSKLEEVNRPYL